MNNQYLYLSGEHFIQLFSLNRSARKAVKDEALGALGRLDRIPNNADHDVIRHYSTTKEKL